jgi:hypothetical protein
MCLVLHVHPARQHQYPKMSARRLNERKERMKKNWKVMIGYVFLDKQVSP